MVEGRFVGVRAMRCQDASSNVVRTLWHRASRKSAEAPAASRQDRLAQQCAIEKNCTAASHRFDHMSQFFIVFCCRGQGFQRETVTREMDFQRETVTRERDFSGRLSPGTGIFRGKLSPGKGVSAENCHPGHGFSGENCHPGKGFQRETVTPGQGSQGKTDTRGTPWFAYCGD